MDTINQCENPVPNSMLALIHMAPFNVTNGICANGTQIRIWPFMFV